MIRNGRIKAGDKINFVVPTGNFGNILAAYYAREMGLPVDRLICASNKNRVLTDFFDTGVYDINRSFYTTSSPSMDILISSNLERLLFIASGYSDEFVREMMGDLKQKGKYTMPENVMSAINSVFCAGCCDDEGTKDTIKKTFEDYGYLCDTHTAVGINVYEKYAEKTGDKTPTVIDSTANPFKFSRSVLDAVEPGASEGLDEFSMVGELARVTKTSCPPQLADLRDKSVRFRDVCDRDSLLHAVPVADVPESHGLVPEIGELRGAACLCHAGKLTDHAELVKPLGCAGFDCVEHAAAELEADLRSSR